MKILWGYEEYLDKKELKDLMVKIANLSKYQSVVFDSIGLSDKEKKKFDLSLKDYSLSESAFIHIFINKRIHEYIPEVFKELNFSQKNNFISYYMAFRENAQHHGILTDYDKIQENINSPIAQLLLYISYGFYIYVFYMAFNYIWIWLPISLLVAYISSSASSDSVKKQNDIIISKINSELIKSNSDYAKEQLIEAKWINKKDL